jgi:hypothetical protein
MAESREVAAGSASAAVLAEAAATLKSPEVQQAVKDFAGGGGGEAPAPAPAPAPEPEPAPAAGTPPAPAPETTTTPAPAPAAGDPPVEDDYDEETYVTPAAPDPAAKPADGEPTMAQLQEQLRAAQAELERLKTPPAATPAAADPGKTPAPAPAPAPVPPSEITGQVVEETIRRLAKERPEIQAAVRNLGTQRETITTKTEELQTLRSAIDKGEAEIDSLQKVIAFLEEELKADPDDVTTGAKLTSKQNALLQAETRINSSHIKLQRLEGELGRLEGSYGAALDQLRDRGFQEATRAHQDHQASTEFNTQKEQQKKAWEQAFGTYIQKHPEIPESLRNDVEVLLLTDYDGQSDWATWIEHQSPYVDGFLSRHRDAVIKAHTDTRRDVIAAHEPGPKGPAAVAPTPAPSRPMSAREASIEAGRVLKEQLARR